MTARFGLLRSILTLLGRCLWAERRVVWVLARPHGL